MSSSDSSDDENIKLLQEAADVELLNDKLYKNSTKETAACAEPLKSLRKSKTDEENYDNLLKVSPGVQNFIAKQLEQYLDQSLTYKSTSSHNNSIKNKRKKSKIKLLSDSTHYIDIKNRLTEEKCVKRPLKNCEFDSEDEEKIKSVLIETENIGKETENWNKSCRTKQIFRYKKSKKGKTLIEI